MKWSDKIELAKKIRAFEQEIQALYKANKIKGTAHLSIGQELPAIDVISQLKEGDIVVTTHRGHHHYLALTQDFQGLKDELLGLPSGVNAGTMGSQHFFVKNRFYAHGLQAGFLPVACGMAASQKLKGTGNIVVAFMGDGTLGEGVLYESLNLASLWKLPIVFIVENNYYAMSTPVKNHLAGSINARFAAFGIPHIDLMDVRRITPSYMVFDVPRLCGHSPRDPQTYRPEGELTALTERDQLA